MDIYCYWRKIFLICAIWWGKTFEEISRDLCNGHRSDFLSFFFFFPCFKLSCFLSIHVLLNIFYKSRFYHQNSLWLMFSLSDTLEVFLEFPLCICMCVSWRFVNSWTWRKDLAASPSSFLGAHLSHWGIPNPYILPSSHPFPLSCTQFHLISPTFKTGL